MITIDKSDKLYKYLSGLGVEDIDELYIQLAKNGRYTRQDVLNYFHSDFSPSITKDIDETELEKVLDYYVDIKKLPSIKTVELKQLLTEYEKNPTDEVKSRIINSQLKDVLLLCINYKSLHEDIDIQDLVQVSSLGLIDALNNYKAKAKIDFKDYIIYYVRKRILEEFKEKKDA